MHRDVDAGVITPAEQVPGYRGAFLFTEEQAADYVEQANR